MEAAIDSGKVTAFIDFIWDNYKGWQVHKLVEAIPKMEGWQALNAEEKILFMLQFNGKLFAGMYAGK